MAKSIESVRKMQGNANTGALQFLPVNLFGSVMGLSGLALAWRQAANVFGAPALIGELIGLLAVVDLLVLGVAYILKLVYYPDKVAAEFQNPIAINFFGTITIAILLISAVMNPYSPRLGQFIWIIGTVATVVLAFIIVARWLKVRQEVVNVTPPWLIATVGTLDVAVAGGTMPFEWAKEVNLFTFAVGSILALVLFTLIIARLMHHDTMPERMTPSYVILIAPFEVGFLAYTNIIQGIDMFASILFYFGLFMFGIIFFKVFKFKFPFFATWWAVSFPMAALSNAAFKYAVYTNSWPLKLIAGILLAILTAVILDILIRSVYKLCKGELLTS